MPGSYDKYTAAITEIAHEWPLGHPEMERQAHSYPRINPYTHAALFVHEQALASLDHAPKPLTTELAAHGVRTIGRYCSIAETVAHRDGLSVAELSSIMRNPESFDPLAMIAHVQTEVATEVEGQFGLLSGALARTVRSDGAQEYGVLAGALAIPRLYYAIDDEKDALKRQGKLREGRCPMDKIGNLSKIYQAFVTICERDAHLFPARLRVDMTPQLHS